MADIVLEDEADILESGIEIIARPPGKELRSISLMSGGEKTMTAVALLLAIFRSKPSPFCILDEVDAALDEANIGRFTAVLREFLDRSQFIIVTHSKKTMAAADVLYGITMQESGISQAGRGPLRGLGGGRRAAGRGRGVVGRSVDDDQTFRLVMLAGVVLIVPVAVYHRVRRHATGERLDRRQEGLCLLIAIRVLGLLGLWAGLVAFLIDPAVGGVGVGAAAGRGSVGRRRYRRRGGGVLDLDAAAPWQESHRYGRYAEGPYARHDRAVPLGAAPVLRRVRLDRRRELRWRRPTYSSSSREPRCSPLLVVRTRIEEAKLVERFGDDYQAYMRRTGRFFPASAAAMRPAHAGGSWAGES